MHLRIFVLASELPKPDWHAGDRRFFALLGMLARRHQVDLCLLADMSPTAPPLPAKRLEDYRCQLEGLGIRLLPGGWKNGEAALRKNRYDIGFFESYHAAFPHAHRFRWHQPGARVVVDSVDLHWVRDAGAAKLGMASFEQVAKNRWRELLTYRAADAVVAVSETDRDILSAEGRMPPLAVLPIVLPTRPRAPGPRPQEVLFVGGFNHHPNQDGLLWFAETIWPRVRDAVPGADLVVVGSNPPAEIVALGRRRGITVRGYVPQTSPYLDHAAVSVAPLRFGAGMKGKVIEAMASGVPVVTTSVGAQGIKAVPGEHLFIADEPDDFARALIALLQDADRCERVGLAGQQLAAAFCSPDIVEQMLEQVLQSLAPTQDGNVSPLRSRARSAAFFVRWTFRVRSQELAEKLRLRNPVVLASDQGVSCTHHPH
jgi:glycosyltransferase involved in cell wall biosynthesis